MTTASTTYRSTRRDELAASKFDEGGSRSPQDAGQSMLAMRRIVYDNDHQAKDLKGDFRRWLDRARRLDGGRRHTTSRTTAGGASRATGCATSTSSAATAGPDAAAHHRLHGLQQLRAEPAPAAGENWVGDLMLECEVSRQAGGGVGAGAVARASTASRRLAWRRRPRGTATLVDDNDARRQGSRGAERPSPTRLKKTGTYQRPLRQRR